MEDGKSEKIDPPTPDPDEIRARDEAESADGERVECVACAELIRERAKVCRFCGHDQAKKVRRWRVRKRRPALRKPWGWVEWTVAGWIAASIAAVALAVPLLSIPLVVLAVIFYTLRHFFSGCSDAAMMLGVLAISAAAAGAVIYSFRPWEQPVAPTGR